MKTKIPDIVFAILFMSALIVPLALLDPDGGKVSEQENRTLAARPPLADMIRRPQGFIRQFDGWFTDNTGFRPGMIDLYKQVDRIETRGLYTEGEYRYLIGEQGHRFFAGGDWVDMVSIFQGKPLLDDEQLGTVTARMKEMKQYLDERGIPFVVMICTDKESIYPEYYSKSIKRGPEPAPLDTLTDYLRENTGADVFNIKECLLAEKDNYLLYNKDSGDLTHYNDIGAFFAYRELMDHISAYMPDMEPFTLDDIDIAYNGKGIPGTSLKQGKTSRKLGAGFFDDVEIVWPFTWANLAFEKDGPALPTILIMRDSYSCAGDEKKPFLSGYIPEHFSKTILIHYDNIAHFEEYIDLYKPDIVVFEAVDRNLCSFAYSITDPPS